MPLPKIATPSYELELPSTGKTIKYRPFLVKEEKLLVIALESEDMKQITNAIKAVIRACVLTKGIKVETLPTFDIEYLFLNIRGKSVGEDMLSTSHVLMMKKLKRLLISILMTFRLKNLKDTLIKSNLTMIS